MKYILRVTTLNFQESNKKAFNNKTMFSSEMEVFGCLLQALENKIVVRERCFFNNSDPRHKGGCCLCTHARQLTYLSPLKQHR